MLGLLILIATAFPATSVPTQVDVAEINTVQSSPTASFTQIILWRWQANGVHGPDHYVAQWSMLEPGKWSVVRDGNRYLIRYWTTHGQRHAVSARSWRQTSGVVDPEVEDRNRLDPTLRKPYITETKGDRDE